MLRLCINLKEILRIACYQPTLFMLSTIYSSLNLYGRENKVVALTSVKRIFLIDNQYLRLHLIMCWEIKE